MGVQSKLYNLTNVCPGQKQELTEWDKWSLSKNYIFEKSSPFISAATIHLWRGLFIDVSFTYKYRTLEHVCALGTIFISSCTNNTDGAGSKPVTRIRAAPVQNMSRWFVVMVGINLISSSVRSENFSCNTSSIVPSRKEKEIGKQRMVFITSFLLRVLNSAHSQRVNLRGH